VDVKDGLPAPVLHDDRAIEGPQYTTCFGYHANQTKREGALLLAIKIARYSHRDGDDGSSARGLDEAGRYQPDEAGRKRVGVADIARGGNVDTNALQEADIDIVAKDGSKTTEKRANAKDTEADNEYAAATIHIGDAPHQGHCYDVAVEVTGNK